MHTACNFGFCLLKNIAGHLQEVNACSGLLAGGRDNRKITKFILVLPAKGDSEVCNMEEDGGPLIVESFTCSVSVVVGCICVSVELNLTFFCLL